VCFIIIYRFFFVIIAIGICVLYFLYLVFVFGNLVYIYIYIFFFLNSLVRKQNTQAKQTKRTKKQIHFFSHQKAFSRPAGAHAPQLGGLSRLARPSLVGH
jgi:hypothetical protein